MKTPAESPAETPAVEEPPVVTPADLEELRATLTQWLSIPPEDADVIDFCLAVVKSHEIPGDPLWGIIIDASGAGKTELFRAFRGRENTYFLTGLTEKSLVSGYRDPKKPAKDPSLLPELHEKVLVIKDLSPLLSMRRESRNAIISQLRDAYDGFTDQGRGNVGKVAYEARFSLLAAATLAVERFSSVDQELGERFIKFRSHGDASTSKVRKAIDNLGKDNPMRAQIKDAVWHFLDSLPPIGDVEIPGHLRERLVRIADIAAKARSQVARDRSGNVQYLPRPEVGTRLGKELGKLLLALAAVRGKPAPDERDLATVQRVAWDCLPPNRYAILRVLWESKKQLPFSDVEKATRLPGATVWRTLDDLAVLGIAGRDAEGNWILLRNAGSH